MVKTSGGATGAKLFMSDVLGHLIGEYSSTGALVASRRAGLFVDARTTAIDREQDNDRH
jgi:hypothetical protein